MTKKTCDRCGAEMPAFPFMAATFPWFSIVRSDSVEPSATRPVDLCKRCEKDFEQWLKTKPEGEDDENHA